MRGISSLIFAALKRVWRGGAGAASDRARYKYGRHTPRKRGIQYAAAFRLNHGCWWNTGSPAFAGDDTVKADLLAVVERQ
jgi:hypothetical protein